MLDIGFQIRWVPSDRKRVWLMDDDDFVRNLGAQLLQRSKAEEEKVKKENRDFDLIEAKAPADWKKLKAWLKEKITQLPPDLVTYEEKLDSVEIKYSTARELRTTQIVFRQVGKVVTQIDVKAKGGGTDGELAFECEVQGQNLIWFYATNQTARFDPAGMGQRILTEATRG
jgi:hypothetical protein